METVHNELQATEARLKRLEADHEEQLRSQREKAERTHRRAVEQLEARLAEAGREVGEGPVLRSRAVRGNSSPPGRAPLRLFLFVGGSYVAFSWRVTQCAAAKQQAARYEAERKANAELRARLGDMAEQNRHLQEMLEAEARFKLDLMSELSKVRNGAD